MANKKSTRAISTLLALFSLITLLIYYSFNDYSRRAETFKKNADRALQEAINLSEIERRARINAYWKRDFFDSGLVKVKALRGPGNELKINVYEPKTDNIELSFSFMSIPYSDTLSDAFLREKMDQGILDGNGNIRVFFIDTLAKRYEVYEDTVSFLPGQLNGHMTDQLESFSINSSYRLVFSEDTSLSGFPKWNIVTDLKALGFKKEDKMVAAVFTSPQWELLSDMRGVLIVNTIVFVLILVVVIQMRRVIAQQNYLVQLKDDFIDNVTHELLTPVSTLTVGVESLENYIEHNEKEKAVSYARLVKAEVGRVSKLVKGVLQSSSVYKGAVELSTEEIKLQPILQELREYYLQKSEKPLTFDIECSSSLTVFTDRQHLISILHNIIDNAIKYSSHSHKSVSLSVQYLGNLLEIKVSDNGIGIPKGEWERIFDKFHRVNQNDTHDVKGLGIGLYYVKTILERLNGKIKLERSSPRGSTFTITLDQLSYAVTH